jgi:HTH-type transcriptional regulator/antitoxin HigA
MPVYEELLAEAAPAVIESFEEYETVDARFSELIGKGKRRTSAETKLMRLLGLIIKDYDRRHALPPDNSTPAEILQFLMEHSGRTNADLIPIFGTRSHVSEALRGRRKISADHARALGRMFHVAPGLFIGS